MRERRELPTIENVSAVNEPIVNECFPCKPDQKGDDCFPCKPDQKGDNCFPCRPDQKGDNCFPCRPDQKGDNCFPCKPDKKMALNEEIRCQVDPEVQDVIREALYIINKPVIVQNLVDDATDIMNNPERQKNLKAKQLNKKDTDFSI